MSDPPAKPDVEPESKPPTPALPGTVAECHALIEQLLARVQALEERVNLNSNNSSRPPSSNGPAHPNRAQRRASQRKRGAQPGHKGHSRAMLDESEVDRLIDCRPQAVCECGAAIQPDDGPPQRHQVFDVPPLRATVEEYRLHSGRCRGCGKRHRGALPAGVPQGQLGSRALSLIGVMATRYHLTQRKIGHLLDQLMGLRFSIGAISQAHGKVAEALKAPVAQAVTSLASAPALWMDETHYKRESTSRWVWAAVQPKLAVFALYPSRARYVIADIIGKHCTAAITTDRYAAYAFIGVERRQICWAHLLRDFNRIAQRAGAAGQIGRRLHALGLVMFRKRDKGQLQGPTLQGLQRRLQAALTRGSTQRACSRTARTCDNILKLWPALWTFTTNPALAPTNNAAEQALRSSVLRRKISGPSRSLRGDRFIARGFTAHETCLRQGRDLWQFLHGAVHAFIAGTAPPSLLPVPATPAGHPSG